MKKLILSGGRTGELSDTQAFWYCISCQEKLGWPKTSLSTQYGKCLVCQKLPAPFLMDSDMLNKLYPGVMEPIHILIGSG